MKIEMKQPLSLVRSKVLFLGNGINQLYDNTYKWGNVINSLLTEFNIEINNVGIPFHILFDEIILKSYRNGSFDEHEKMSVKLLLKKLAEIEKNKYHKSVINLDYEHILTTNFDMTFYPDTTKSFKRVALPEFGTNQSDLTKKTLPYVGSPETKYRLRTANDLGSHKVWHIHGEISDSNTIVLSYEMYSKVLARMDEYMQRKIDKSDNPFEMTNVENSWIDMFFACDIDFFGYGLDFTEMDIWYLLNQRARLINRLKLPSHQINKIVYHNITTDKKDIQLVEDKKVLYESFHIEFKQYNVDNYYQAYDIFFNEHIK